MQNARLTYNICIFCLEKKIHVLVMLYVIAMPLLHINFK